MTNAVNKHRAVLNIRLEVHEVLPTGECAGRPVKLSEFPDYKLRPAMVVAVDGHDLHNCLLKLKEKLEELTK